MNKTLSAELDPANSPAIVRQHAAANDIATIIVVIVGIVPVIIGSKAERHEYTPVKSVVKATAMKATAMKSTAVESAACEAAVESSAREAAVEATATAVKTTTTTAAAAVTTAAATTTTATGRRGGRLNQAHGCQCH